MNQPAALRDLPRSKPRKWVVPERYAPLLDCPPERRSRYLNAEKNARNGSLAAMVKLFCLQCMGWNHAEVKRCEARGCALSARARREPAQ